MRHAATLCTVALAFLLAAVAGAQAESICDSLPTDVFEGVAVVTAFRHTPNQSLDYSPDYEVTRDLTLEDGTRFGATPLGDGADNGHARRMLYHVDCAIGQDTVFTVANLEDQDAVTVSVEYFFNGNPIFTQGNTIRPGKVVKLSAANALARSY